jgi:predicted membrane-bound spermidine synthase
VSLPRSGFDLFAAVGPRVGVEIPLTRSLALRLRADALVDLARAVVNLDNSPAWRASLFTGTLGAGFALRIP